MHTGPVFARMGFPYPSGQWQQTVRLEISDAAPRQLSYLDIFPL